MLIDAWNYILTHPTQFWRALQVHVMLSASALAIAAVISIPAGIAVARRSGSAAPQKFPDQVGGSESQPNKNNENRREDGEG